jgi:SPP1 gp7 family putative phage head morphogenesis protein
MNPKYIMPDSLTEKEAERLEANLRYWDEDRIAAAQVKLTTKSIKETEKQLAGYYGKTMQKITGQFELTYLRLTAGIKEGIQPTPADLYRLNSYWEMQGQLRDELNKLGYYQLNLFEQQFTNHFIEIYESLAAIDKTGAFNTVSADTAKQVINNIWCADGKAWKQRIWENTELLREELNEGLIDCVVMGKKSDWLIEQLQSRFDVSNYRATSLVKTELSHIQTQAAKQRYMDMGAKEFEVWAEKDERQCKICGKLHKTKYPIGAQPPIPAHPKCRCTIIPVV